MHEEPINFNRLKGKIEKDEDWREGVNAFRNWTNAEIEKLQKDIHDIKVFMEQYRVSVDFIKSWKKRQDKEETKIQGESL
tara:strand:+ start:88 stop:327 length:240 start_codon:yes stop_codon:yes gene_type:complete